MAVGDYVAKGLSINASSVSYSNTSINADVAACYSSWNDFSKSSSSACYITSLYTNTQPYTEVYTSFKADIYTTLCDGYPRARGYDPAIADYRLGNVTTPSATTITTAIQITSGNSGTDTVERPCSTKTPDCTIGTAQCAPLWQSFYSSVFESTSVPPYGPPCTSFGDQQTCNNLWSSWTRATRLFPSTGPGITWVPNPECSTTTAPPLTTATATYNGLNCSGCLMSADTIRMLYWPETSLPPAYVSSLLGCNASSTAFNFSIPTPTETTPCTTVFSGVTLTSPTVYFSFNRLAAAGNCQTELSSAPISGSILHNTIIAVPSSDVKLAVWAAPYFTSQAFNFAWLPPNPVPYSVYALAPACHHNAQCGTTIYDNGFAPGLMMPTQITELEPAWSTCQVAGNDGPNVWVFDPPVALTPASAVAGPTAYGYTASTESTSASPSPTPAPVASETLGSTSYLSSSPVAPTPASYTAAQPSASTGASESTDEPTQGPNIPQSAATLETSDPSETTSDRGSSAAGVVASLLGYTGAASRLSSYATSPTSSVEATNSGAGIVASILANPSAANTYTQSSNSDVGHTTTKTPLVSPAQYSAQDTDQTQAASTALVTAEGQTFTIYPTLGASSAVQIAVQGTTASLDPGASTSIGSQPVNIDPSGNIVIGSQTVTTSTADATPATATPTQSAIIDPSGDPITGLQAGSSVLLQAGSTIATLAYGAQTSFAGHDVSAQPSNSGSGIIIDSDSTVTLSDPTSTAAADASGDAVTVSQAGSSLVVQAQGTTATLAYGAQTTIAGHSIDAHSYSGGAVVIVDGTSVVALSGPGSVATISAGQQAVSVILAGSSLVLQAGDTTATLAYGAQTTFAGHSVSAPASGSNGLVIDVSSTVPIMDDPQNSAGKEDGTATLTAGGATFTAIAAGSSVVLQGAGSTLTIADGASTAIGGENISIDPNGTGIVVCESTTIPLAGNGAASAPAPALAAVATVTLDGETFTAAQNGASVILEGASTTVTLSNGASTIIDGQTVAVLSDGGGLEVGSSTIALTGTEASPARTSDPATSTTGHESADPSGSTSKPLPATASAGSASPAATRTSASATRPRSWLLLVAGLALLVVCLR